MLSQRCKFYNQHDIDSVKRLILLAGDDPDREGLKETPERVINAYKELFAGYGQDPADLFKTFDGEKYDELILVTDVEFVSTCEHHMMPFVGWAHVAYIPDGRVIGLSKLPRLVDVYARRLQLQERITVQVTEAMDKYLKPKGSACIIQAKHMCLSCRGAMKQKASMITSSLTGAFKENAQTRSELLALLR